MTAVSCPNAADRKADRWAQQLAPFPAPQFAVSDAAKGIAKAVAGVAASRHDIPDAPALEHGLDVFPTTREARRVLSRHWRRAEAAWEHAEGADGKVADAKRQGVDARGVAGAARAAWSKAVASFRRVERLESAWGRAEAALELFTPEGRLNDPLRADAEIAAAVGELSGPEWSKVRNFLTDPHGLTSLERMQRRLEQAESHRESREAMAWRWWLKHHRREPADRLTELVRSVGRETKLNESERASYDRVAAVLKDTFRASSVVECMNSVLRMQQSRHRRMTQPRLDLKRLYWNTRPFRSGRRKDISPYQALGLRLPSCDFWELLHADPARLTQELSTQGTPE